LAVILLSPFASFGEAPPHPDDVTPSTAADRAEAARCRAEMEAFQRLLERERGRPSGARIRDPVDRQGHRLLLFVETRQGAIERVESFEQGRVVRATFVLVLDAQRRLRFLVIEPEDEDVAHQAFEIDQYLFDTRGRTLARDHTYGTSLDCADGRLHERRTVTLFRPTLQMISRAVELPNDFGPGPPAEGCARPAARASLPDAPSLLHSWRLEGAVRAAGVP
jgi:hypothetical protein